MALTGAELRTLRRKVGSAPDDAELQTIYDAYEADGAAEPIEWVILDVLERRLADLQRNPASFTVPGDYAQSTAANIKALEDAVADQRAHMAALGIEVDGVLGGWSITAAADPTYVR